MTEVEDGGYGATEALAGAVTQATLEGVRESKRRMSRLQVMSPPLFYFLPLLFPVPRPINAESGAVLLSAWDL